MGKLNIRSILAQNKALLVVILIVFTTPWTWKILNDNLLLCLSLIIITVIFVKLLLNNKRNTRLILLFCSIFVVVSAVNVQLGFDRNLRKLNVNEEVQLNERHNYFAKELREFFLNKYSLNYYKNYNLSFYKFQRNFFSALDPNLYFFAGHPRERAGINEFEKFQSLYLIFFIIGIVYSLQLQSLLAIAYLLVAALINGFIAPTYRLGPILFFPFVTALTALGIMYSVALLKSLIRKIH
ncbi:MAG: hypothetical protein PHE48_01805 [Candidatus Daviesbacteria bacterium]|nr:hypothetical protein [Candidatus Daviesbacteria bacterium]